MEYYWTVRFHPHETINLQLAPERVGLKQKREAWASLFLCAENLFSLFRLVRALLGLCTFFFGGLAVRFAASRYITRGGAVIGCIEPGTLENDLGRGDHFLQGLFPAFRAGFQRLIVKRLMSLELNTTIFAAVCINGHKSYSFIATLIIARPY